MASPVLFATSDLHVLHTGNREVVEQIGPRSSGDWLIVAGDVADTVAAVTQTLAMLRDRFERVIWTPGNHELWTPPTDPVQDRGERRYLRLVQACRELDVLTPEDPYAIWRGDDEALAVVPVFTLYDYSWTPPGRTAEQALAESFAARVVVNDEFLLHPDPYPSRPDWCRRRVDTTLERLEQIPADLRTVLVSHWPLHRAPTRMLRQQHIALWCGTQLTEDWHRRFRASVAVYGHLHIPLTLEFDGVRFEEVSLGYPREWRRRGSGLPDPLRQVLPQDPARRPQNDLLEAVAARRRAG
jgi:3',5'-cyclic AMP phosphodiesterase CpdA